MAVHFEWNREKLQTNFKKHHVSFEEAVTVFRNPLARIFDDREHSLNEKREIIIGHSTGNRLIIVCFTERYENVIRIISARLATRKEQKDYEERTRI